MKELKGIKEQIKEQIYEHPITKKHKEYLNIRRQAQKHEHEDIVFKAILNETAFSGTSTSYYIRKYVNNKPTDINFDAEENKVDIYVVLDKMIQIRKDLYVEKLKQLKNIRVEEKLRCVFKKEIVSDNEVINYTFATVNIPTNDQKKQIKYKFVNSSSIETQLKHSTEYFIDGIEQYIENGSNFKLDSILGMKCYIDAYKPLRGSSYVELPSYIENKKAIINVKNKDNECFILSL